MTRAPGETFEVSDAGHAWRAAVTAALVVIAGQLAYAAIDLAVYATAGALVSLRLAHAGVAGVVLAVLLAERARPSRAWSAGAFVAVVLPLYSIFWLAEAQIAATGLPWSPFVGHKIAMVGVALLAPGGGLLGGVLVAGFAVQAVVLWHALGLGARPEVIAAGEPWVTAVHALIAVALLVHRARHVVVEREIQRARAEAEALERLARVLLAVRDRANTPLQSLEVATELMARRCPGEAPTIRRMKQALARLRRMAHLMTGADRFLHWRHPDASLDADAVLRDLEAAWARTEARPRPRG